MTAIDFVSQKELRDLIVLEKDIQIMQLQLEIKRLHIKMHYSIGEKDSIDVNTGAITRGKE